MFGFVFSVVHAGICLLGVLGFWGLLVVFFGFIEFAVV